MPAPLSARAPRRVLLTADAVGGVWTYCLDLAAELAGMGVETLLVVLGPSPPADLAADAAGVPGLTLVDTGLALDWTATDAAELADSVAGVRKLAEAWRPDVVHLHSPALVGEGGFPAPVVGVCHSCLATWWSAVRSGPLPEDFRWRSRLARRGMQACDVLLAPTRAFAESVGRTYELPPPKAVWNGREATVHTPRIGEREALVLTSGRLWDEGKNVATLDAAAGRIAAPLIAAGPLQGPKGGGVRLSHARPVGRLSPDEMTGWLRRASVYGSAALYEPFGLGVLEAAQAGCALVLSDIPSFRELWDGAAVFAPPQDADAFAGAFDALLADPGEAQRLAARARARAETYTSARMTAGVVEAWSHVLRGLAEQTREAVA